MQVSEIRALRALYAHKHFLFSASHELITSRPSSISCKYPSKTPINSRHSCTTPQQRTFHSTYYRSAEESPSGADGTNTWTGSNSFSNQKNNKSHVSTAYDPVTGRLITKRGAKSEEESTSSSDYEDALKDDRSYGSVVKGDRSGGSGKGNGFGSKKKGKTKTNWVCSDCGYTDGQWWGYCRSCQSAGTMKEFSDFSYGGGRGKTSGFEVSENLVQSWLPQKQGEAVPLRLTDVNRGMNQLNWRIPFNRDIEAEVEWRPTVTFSL